MMCEGSGTVALSGRDVRPCAARGSSPPFPGVNGTVTSCQLSNLRRSGFEKSNRICAAGIEVIMAVKSGQVAVNREKRGTLPAKRR